MLEPIPFWGMIEVDLQVKTYAGNKANYIKEDMNNEPVAWISEYTLKNCLQGNFTDEVRATTKETTNCTIPLYTHPVELTDEEIADFLYAYCLDMGDIYEASEEQFIKCVRAILRKASEK